MSRHLPKRNVHEDLDREKETDDPNRAIESRNQRLLLNLGRDQDQNPVDGKTSRDPDRVTDVQDPEIGDQSHVIAGGHVTGSLVRDHVV